MMGFQAGMAIFEVHPGRANESRDLRGQAERKAEMFFEYRDHGWRASENIPLYH